MQLLTKEGLIIVEKVILKVKQKVSFRWWDLLTIVFAFMLGRVVFFDCLSPFALALFAAYISVCPDNIIRGGLVAFGSLMGIFSAGMGITFIKYILAFVLFALVFTAVTTVSDKRGKYTTSLIGAISLFVSGLIFLGQWQRSLYYLAMLISESVVCFFMAMVFEKTISIANQTEKEITPDSSVGFLVMVALSVAGLGELTVFNISLGKTLSAVYIMLVALCGGLGPGSVCGVGMGFLYSFLMYPSGEYMGLFSIFGMLCGIFSRYKKAGVICSFVISSLIVTWYFGISNGAMFNFPELVLTSLVLGLIPKSVTVFCVNLLCQVSPAPVNFKQTILKIYDKLSEFSGKLNEIADNFADSKKPRNKNDIMGIYDKTAGKVCRNCGLKFVCWEKEFSSSYDALINCNSALLEKGKLEVGDVPVHFKSKCIKLNSFIEAVNRFYARYKLDTMWVKKLEAGRELTATHLYGVAEIMNDFAKETKKELDFVPDLGNILYLAIGKAGVKCYDVTVVTREKGQLEVVARINVKKAPDNVENIVADVVAETAGRRFYVKNSDYSKDGTKAVLRLEERERYNVVTGYYTRKKDDSERSGDSFCQQKLQHNRYLAVLSDGMGSGANAKNQSSFAADTMSRLLNTGFDKESAVKIMNLSLFLKQTEESFATVDAVVVDLFEGSAEFIKIGASSSFVKSNSKVKRITSDSLPAGMITGITPCTEKINIKGGDLIVLASDGVFGDDGEWVTEYIKESTDKPQKLAEKLVKEAVVRQGHKTPDDMTVVTMLIDREAA
ncbi:MAG: SpoIIE family protein phosphatase [Clostridia bacterium]|nr:SpoIIE family protein phosphatase [Clostridia bacterium]